MKLKNKLFLNFGIILFFSINIFGITLIESSFNLIIKNIINSSIREYSVIYTNIKSGENINNIFMTNKDILKVRSEYYFKNTDNPNISLEFRNLDKELVYSTKKIDIIYPESLYYLKDTNSNYIVHKKKNKNFLLINSILTINGEDFYFIYINDLNSLYKYKINNIYTLIELNILIGLIVLLSIYFIVVDITKPIDELIKSMDEIIKGNYNKKFIFKSNIKEINDISINFSSMNNEIRNKILELKKQNEIKQRFIDNLTHEIRTPLTTIIGYSDLVVKKNIQNMSLIHNSFMNINREGKRILSLTSNLVTLITLDKKSLELNNYSIVEIIKEVERSFNIRFKENNINFIIKGNDFLVYTDKNLFLILVNNLIDNSIKSVLNREKRDIYAIIDIDRVIIKDTGNGISKEDLEKIFEPFYMVDKSRSKSIEGFGLGLSICKEIIYLLDIEFNIESKINYGTEVILKLKR